MKKKTILPIRQGDVLLIPDGYLPRLVTAKGEEIPANGTRVVLAEGESSGHVHTVDSDRAKLYRLAGQAESTERILDRVLEITKKAKIHIESTTSRARQDERHAPVDVPVGTWRLRVMAEYSPEAIRSTAD